MATVPQLLAWHICDNVHVDPSTGKTFLLGCFSAVRSRQFPATHPRMIWFLTIGDVAQGKHMLRISMGLEMDKLEKLVEREFESPGPQQQINLINQMQNLQFETPGNYQILIEVDGEPLLVTSLIIAE
ncbi:MAG: hypothetical protein Q7P63_09400 [Verrucomicrobiota bacterium JB022]|nr:hypothetical protein [Verrucomicrobiota bacterium JB022]